MSTCILIPSPVSLCSSFGTTVTGEGVAAAVVEEEGAESEGEGAKGGKEVSKVRAGGEGGPGR